MKKKERHDWIAEYIKNNGEVDVLNADFVWAYSDKFSPKDLKIQMLGAPKSIQIGKDLSSMHDQGILKRRSVGLGDGLSGSGFPKWVYCYKIEDGKRYHED